MRRQRDICSSARSNNYTHREIRGRKSEAPALGRAPLYEPLPSLYAQRPLAGGPLSVSGITFEKIASVQSAGAMLAAGNVNFCERARTSADAR